MRTLLSLLPVLALAAQAPAPVVSAGLPDYLRASAPIECGEEYGSTYSSNCSCLFCTKYCQVDGRIVKSGTCC